MSSALALGAGRADILSFGEIDPESWDDLQRRAGSAHPFYGRHVMAAHRAAGLAPPQLRFLAIRSGERLDALVPFALRRDVSALGGLVGGPFTSPYITSTAPLIAEEPGDAAILAEALAAASGGRAWRWPLLSTEAGGGARLVESLRQGGWRIGIVSHFRRPVLRRHDSHAAFLAKHPHRGRFKDLRRRARRLGEMGRIAFESATGGERLRGLVEAFLVLENAGWKGRAGTALACRPATTAFARALFAEGSGPVTARADALTLDGRPVAISLALAGGGTATLLKTAYDEGLRQHAPGLLLEEEIVRLCHETGFAGRLDSATLPGSPLDGLYPDGEEVAEIIAAPPGREALSLDRRLRLAQFELSGRETAKRLLRTKRG